MRGKRHVLLLGPLVAGRVVLPDRAWRRTRHADRIPAEEIELAVRDDAVPFLVHFGNRREAHPASVGVGLTAAAPTATLRTALAAAAATLRAALGIERNRTHQH